MLKFHNANFNDKAILHIPSLNKEIELTIEKDHAERKFLNISNLYQHKIISLDTGLGSTAYCTSSITHMENGILQYRGYDIITLAQQSSFMEVAYLLLYGKLPNYKEHQNFIYNIKHHTMIDAQIQLIYQGFTRASHPLAMMCGALHSLAAFYHDHINIYDSNNREAIAIKLIAKLPTICAMAYKYSIGQPYVEPNNDLDYSSNFIHMLFAVPSEKYIVSLNSVKVMDLLFLLHADSEQDVSNTVLRVAASSGANPFAAIASAITASSGFCGISEQVIKMLENIEDISRIPFYIARAKNPKDSFKFMGFGSDFYKNNDCRIKIIKSLCYDVIRELKINDPLLDIALELEKATLEDEYFTENKLHFNIDFYSSLICRAMGITTKLFTGIFAIARSAGWISQWMEMLSEEPLNIIAPRQAYKGKSNEKYLNIQDR